MDSIREQRFIRPQNRIKITDGFMNSIRNKIRNAFMGSILVLGVCAIGVLSVTQVNATNNQRIIETMTREYSIITLTDNVISAYNDAVKNPGDAGVQAAYQTARSSALEVITSLKNEVVSADSQAVLIGVENTVMRVINECDAGLQEVKGGNLLNLSAHFVTANSNNDFVRDNTRTLLQKELEYLSRIQENSKRVYLYTIIGSAGLFVVFLFGMLIFANSFSKQLVSPIEKLSQNAKQISGGDMDVVIDQKLLEQKDEVGILSESFASMLRTINSKIAELKDSNKELEDSKTALEEGNSELEKLNAFMVDRELKMVQLKKKISELEGKVGGVS